MSPDEFSQMMRLRILQVSEDGSKMPLNDHSSFQSRRPIDDVNHNEKMKRRLEDKVQTLEAEKDKIAQAYQDVHDECCRLRKEVDNQRTIIEEMVANTEQEDDPTEPTDIRFYTKEGVALSEMLMELEEWSAGDKKRRKRVVKFMDGVASQVNITFHDMKDSQESVI